MPATVIAGDVMVGDCDTFGALRDGCHRFRQAEVQHLHGAVRAHLDIRGFEIAMDDPLLVRRFERVRDLLRDRQRFVDRDRPRAMRSASVAPSTSSITSARTPSALSRP